MARTQTKPTEPDPNGIHIAWQSFAVQLGDGTSPTVAKGTRLRGDSPIVQAAPWGFVPDGSSPVEQAEAAAAYTARNPLPEQVPDFPAPPPPLRDEDAAVAIRSVNSMLGDRSGTGQLEQAPLAVEAGERLPKDHPTVQANPSAFVPVRPGRLARSDALVATARLVIITDKPIEAIGVYEGRGKNEYVVHEGTWIARDPDNPFVRSHSVHLRSPAPEPLDVA